MIYLQVTEIQGKCIQEKIDHQNGDDTYHHI